MRSLRQLSVRALLALAFAASVFAIAWPDLAPAQTRVVIRNAENTDFIGVTGKPLVVSCSSGCSGGGGSSAPYAPTGQAVLAVTTSTARVALGSADDVTILVNNGTADLYFKLGNSSVNAATTDTFLGAGRAIAVDAGSSTHVAAITASGTASLQATTGTGSPFFSGGGGGGGSSALTAGEAHVGQVGGTVLTPSANFDTPAGTTAYGVAELIANHGTGASVTPMSFTACRVNAGSAAILRARYKTNDSGFAGKSVGLKLYKDSPTATNGDNGAWLTTESNFIGTINVVADQTFSNPLYKGIGTPAQGGQITFDCASGSTTIYGLMVANEGITPQGAKTHTWVLEEVAN